MDHVDARRLLGVSATATHQEIEAAFRNLVMTTHPDRGGRPEAFRAVVDARRSLLATAPRRPPAVTVVPDGGLFRQVLVAIVRRILDRQTSPPGRRVV